MDLNIFDEVYKKHIATMESKERQKHRRGNIVKIEKDTKRGCLMDRLH